MALALLLSRARACPQSPPLPGTPTGGRSAQYADMLRMPLALGLELVEIRPLPTAADELAAESEQPP